MIIDFYQDNLKLYTALKTIIQLKLNDKKLIYFSDIINKATSKKMLFDMLEIFDNKIEVIAIIINLFTDDELKKIKIFLTTSIELLLLKDLILAEAKNFINEEYKKELQNTKDLLSLKHDLLSLAHPYGFRVASCLLISILTNPKSLLKLNQQSITSLHEQIEILTKIYHINLEDIFQIVIDESVNQSIRSTAGSSYEDRVFSSLYPIVHNLQSQSFDGKINSVEYDFTFYFKGKKFGVSAKRTLRERYKQNHENCEELDVDFMLVITLGIDLNKNKVQNILEKNGTFVVVAQEQYEKKSYFKNNLKVISSNNIENGLKMIIKLYETSNK